jgi:hypothetical protein
MTDTSETPASDARHRAGRPRGKSARKHIPMPDGDYLEPREEFADTIGVTNRTAQKLNLPTTYIGGMAYVPHNKSLAIIASRVRRPAQPEQPRRGRR